MDKNKQVKVTIPESLHQEAIRVGDANGMTFSAFTRLALLHAVRLPKTIGLPVGLDEIKGELPQSSDIKPAEL